MTDISPLFLNFPLPQPQPLSNLVEVNRHALEPGKIVEAGVVTNTFQDHLLRPKPSQTPGVDIDTRYLYTEGPPYLEKPVIRSNVSGTVMAPRGGNWGTVRIRDKADYEHFFLHMSLDPTPLNKAPANFVPVKLGQKVTPTTPIGLLSNTKAERDHVHYFIKSPKGELLNPANLWFDEDGSVIGIKDQDQYRFERWLQGRDRYDTIKYDNVQPARGNTG